MRSFTARVTIRFALLVTATTAAVLTIGGVLLDRSLLQSLDLMHDVEATELHGLLGPDGVLDPAAVARKIKQDADSDTALFFIQVADRGGRVLFRSDNLGESTLPDAGGGETHATTTLRTLGAVRLSAFTRGPWRIQVGSLLEPTERLLREYARMSVPLLVGVALLSLGVGYAFSRSTLRPIRAIESIAHRIRADNLTERIPVPGGRDELASLTRLLNQMFDRLQASFDQVRRFTADASHELKTPLALMRLNAEKLRPRVGDDPEAGAAIADLLEELSHLQQVIDRLLFLAKSESGALKPALRSVDLPAFLLAFREDARALAEDRGARFELGRNDAGKLSLEPDLFRQLLLNLVSNAVTASPAGGLIALDSIRGERSWSFVLSDEGPGLTPAQLARLFERFVHFDTGSPPPSQGGHGLGLAICKSIVELHHGTIEAANRSDRSGLRMTVTLPA